MGRTNEVDAPRIDYDQTRSLAQPLLHARGKDRVPVRGIRPDHDDDIRLLDTVKVLRARRCAERGLQPIACRRMANARARIDIVVAECRAHQLLDKECLLVGATRRGYPAQRKPPMLRLDAAELRGSMPDRLLPRHFVPGLVRA